MSQWTHICGNIRVDGLVFNYEMQQEYIERIKKLVGEEVLWEDYFEDFDNDDEDDEDKYKKWEEAFDRPFPMGSEGSARYSIILDHPISPEDSELSSGSICFCSILIHGDLRDFGGSEDIDRVKKWFNSILNNICIRQAVLTIDDECSNSIVILTEKGETSILKKEA